MRVWSAGAEAPHETPREGPPGRIVVRGFPAAAANPYYGRSHAHPLLCGPFGPVGLLPDHGHGECLAARDGTPPDFSGGSGPEVLAWAVRGGSDGVATRAPHAIGTVAAYDGHRRGHGRIAVDASWRGLVNLHLMGEAGHPDPRRRSGLAGTEPGRDVLAHVTTYVRNLALWLAPEPAQRAMWWRALWWTRWHHRLLPVLPGAAPADPAGLLRVGQAGRAVLATWSSLSAVRAGTVTHLLRPHLDGVRPEVLSALDPWHDVAATTPPTSHSTDRSADPIEGPVHALRADLLADLALGAAIAAIARRHPLPDAETRRRGEEADLGSEVAPDVARAVGPILEGLADRLEDPPPVTP